LGEGAEKVDQIRNTIVLVINTRKVDHIKVFNSSDAIDKRYCGTLLFSCTSFNCLYKKLTRDETSYKAILVDIPLFGRVL
jgi:hypothetical protein